MDSREDEQDTSGYDRVTINVVEVQRNSEVPYIAIHSSSSVAYIPALVGYSFVMVLLVINPFKILIDS